MTNTQPQTRSKNRKQEILQLAAHLLQSGSYDSFSYQDLAARLGLSKASIHHHFPHKEDLGLALCDWIEQVHQTFFNDIQDQGSDAWDKLSRYLEGNLNYACNEQKTCPLGALQSDIHSLPDSMKQAVRKLDEAELSFITSILQQGLDSGAMQFNGEPRSQAMLLILSCKGALQASRVHGTQLFEMAMTQFKTLLGASHP